MKIDGKQITFAKNPKIKYSGTVVSEDDTTLTLEGEDEDSYVKVYSPFRGVERLLMFENETWTDAMEPSLSHDFSSLGLEELLASGDLEALKESIGEAGNPEDDSIIESPQSAILDASGNPIKES